MSERQVPQCPRCHLLNPRMEHFYFYSSLVSSSSFFQLSSSFLSRGDRLPVSLRHQHQQCPVLSSSWLVEVGEGVVVSPDWQGDQSLGPPWDVSLNIGLKLLVRGSRTGKFIPGNIPRGGTSRIWRFRISVFVGLLANQCFSRNCDLLMRHISNYCAVRAHFKTASVWVYLLRSPIFGGKNLREKCC